jgi:hypothetical protein
MPQEAMVGVRDFADLKPKLVKCVHFLADWMIEVELELAKSNTAFTDSIMICAVREYRNRFRDCRFEGGCWDFADTKH